MFMLIYNKIFNRENPDCSSRLVFINLYLNTHSQTSELISQSICVVGPAVLFTEGRTYVLLK